VTAPIQISTESHQASLGITWKASPKVDPLHHSSKCRNKSRISSNSLKYAVARTLNVLHPYPRFPSLPVASLSYSASLDLQVVVLLAPIVFKRRILTLAARIQKSYSKLTSSKQTKFKVRCSRFVYTLAIDDSDKADKIRQSLPPCTHRLWERVNGSVEN
jgi:hypothetical protein